MKKITSNCEKEENKLLELIKKELIKENSLFKFCQYIYEFNPFTLQGALVIRLNDFCIKYEIYQSIIVKCKTNTITEDVMETFANEVASQFICTIEAVEDVSKIDIQIQK